MSICYRKDRQKWVVDAVWPDGERTRRVMPNLPAAKKIWRKISMAIVDEDFVWQGLRRRLRLNPKNNSGGVTLHELADVYHSDYCMSNNRDAQAKAYRLGTLKRLITDMPADKVTLRHVDRFISDRQKEGVTNGTINCELTTIRHMFSWALKRSYIGVNHLAAVESLEQVEWEGERPDELVIDEIFSHLPPEYVPIFTFIRNTGCRNGEATTLKWNQLDLGNDAVSFPGTKTKNGKSRSAPLPTPALVAIAATPHTGSYVFSARRDKPIKWNRHSLANAWRLARAKVLDADGQPSQLRVHDLRHAYAIKLA